MSSPTHNCCHPKQQQPQTTAGELANVIQELRQRFDKPTNPDDVPVQPVLNKEQKALNVSISSSPINSKPPTSSPIIYQPSPSLNIPPIPHQQQSLPPLQQQLNLNRLNYLLAIQKQQQNNKNLFSAFLNCNGIINNQNNEQLQQPIFSCNFIVIGLSYYSQIWDNSELGVYEWDDLELGMTWSCPQKTSPVICPSSSSSLCSSSASSACSSTTSTDFPPNSIISEQFNSTQQQHFNFPPQHQFSSSFNCQNCLLEKQRLIEKERELVETRTELERIRSLFLRFGVMLGIKNEVLQQNKNLSGEDRSNNNTTNISSIGGVNNIPNQILLLNKNGAAN
uniref:Uncharacterized protein n=1 Tax=Meloidogyne floridensis TaxID=298350 RepID=A0A915NER8_9BILA